MPECPPASSPLDVASAFGAPATPSSALFFFCCPLVHVRAGPWSFKGPVPGANVFPPMAAYLHSPLALPDLGCFVGESRAYFCIVFIGSDLSYIYNLPTSLDDAPRGCTICFRWAEKYKKFTVWQCSSAVIKSLWKYPKCKKMVDIIFALI